MDEIKAGIQQARGAKAHELLNSDVFKDTLEHLEQEYIASWRKCREQDVAARERLWTAIRVLDHVRAHLSQLVINGRLATKDLAGIKYMR